MGSTFAKLKKYIERGDESVALNFYKRSIKPNKFNVNLPVNETLDTVMHLSVQHGMHELLKLFLYRNNGSANKLNSKSQNVLHRACQGVDDNMQFECVRILINWKDDKTNEKVDVNAKDVDGNTALHFASMNNLANCIQLLLENGAQLFIENKESLTSCDWAEKQGHRALALFLESKMIFSEPEKNEEPEEADEALMEPDEVKYGLNTQDLQEEKDKLLVETADMLQCSIFTAEVLLKKHSWSKELLLHSWISDPAMCCEKCGIDVPLTVACEKDSLTAHIESDNKKTLECIAIVECAICLEKTITNDDTIRLACEHRFCKNCWKSYLTIKIEEGRVDEIFCPQVDCYTLIPHEITEKLVSREAAFKYLQFDIQSFVDMNPTIKWCPHPGCSMAIRDPMFNQTMFANEQEIDRSEFSKSVDCGLGHYYCWECLDEGHEPAGCKHWQDWREKTRYTKPEDLINANEKEETSANYLWLVTNSKSCPNVHCKAPIQKNEGCNHIRCSKCKHDFCWICLEPWKKHNSLTGGYFVCNRYEVSKKVAEKEKTLRNHAEQTYSKTIELNRFIHYYTRYKNHEHSYKLEEPLLNVAKAKYEVLNEQLQRNKRIMSTKTVNIDDIQPICLTSTATVESNDDQLFIEDAIKELLKSRKILRASYVYGFYLDPSFSLKKFIFELIQTEFEECTEYLSQIIARPNLKTPKYRIIRRTKLLRRKRLEFLDTITRGLILPETPPTLKHSKQHRHRWKYALKDDIELNDDYKNLIGVSIKELNQKDSWIVDKNGRHTNLYAILEESPDLQNELETILTPSTGAQGTCIKHDCANPKAINSLTGSIFNYCSIKCLKTDKQSFQETSNQAKKRNPMERQASTMSADVHSSSTSSLLNDLNDIAFKNDMHRAIEMSKIEHINNLTSKINALNTSDLATNKKDDDCDDCDLQLAIELSLNTTRKSYKTMPYSTIFLARDNYLSTLIRNMDDVLYDGDNDGAANDDVHNFNEQQQQHGRFYLVDNGKLSNFEIKSHRLEEELVMPSFLVTATTSQVSYNDEAKS